MPRIYQWIIILLLPFFMTACSGTQQETPGVKIGKPYQIYGTWYRPAFQPEYDEEGIASWYGPGFHGNYTASGERFDKYDMTAAHTTLPMPSIVRVTNLDNGKSAIVRVNDRGPFKENRIIDLSKKAAEALDMTKTGTARVRVQYLHDETERYLVENKIKGREKVIGSQDTRELNEKSMARMNARDHETTSAAPVTEVSSDEPESTATETDPFALKVSSSDRPQPESSADTKISSSNILPTRSYQSGQGELNKAFEYASAKPETSDIPSQKAKPFTPPKNLPESSESAADVSGLYVQAGTFSSKENASRLVKKIVAFGPAHTSEITSGENTMFRVKLGPFASREDGEQALEKLKEVGINDARIVNVK
jgi:rare lipoprotein A